MEIKANKFSTRAELEAEINRISDKKNCKIVGTREELAKLQLSDLRKVFGVACEITDTPTEIKDKAPPKPYRGELKPYGINNNLIK